MTSFFSSGGGSTAGSPNAAARPVPDQPPAFPSRRPASQPANPELAAGQSSGAGRPSNPKAADLSVYKEDGAGQTLTTNQGTRVNDNQNTLKAGERGPSLLEDFHFREKITHFDHERIPERIVHARGNAAHGHFQVYENMSRYTKAGFLQDPGVRTRVFVRFSTVAGSRGADSGGDGDDASAEGVIVSSEPASPVMIREFLDAIAAHRFWNRPRKNRLGGPADDETRGRAPISPDRGADAQGRLQT